MSGCGSVIAEKPNETIVDYFADNGTGNPLAVVQHPAGEYHNGVTYVSYQGPFEDPYVAAYNHKTETWVGPFRAGTSELGRRDGRTKFDNHGKPTVLIDDAGYIHIFYGGHGGDKHHGKNLLGNIHHGANKHSISKRPLDITEWEEVDNISVFGTYNQAIKMDNGDIYLFYRHGAHRSDWVYQKSTDNGRTFAEPESFLKHKRRTDIKAMDSWYAWVGKGSGDEIMVTFDYHICWDGKATKRGHTTERHDAHYMTFNTKTGEWKNVRGETLTMPLHREDAEKQTLVLDTGNDWTFNGTTYLDTDGYPHIATNIGKDLGAKTGGPKLTHHIRWDGKEWLVSDAINSARSTISRGDFVVTEPNDVQFILSDEDGSDGVIAWWQSKDGGKSFTNKKELLRRNKATFAITSMIKNAHPDARVIVAEKSRNTPHRKIYLVGDNGPIKRELKDATLEKDQSTFN
ncbi:BNR-4 repeat-containing protein [Psychrosphaera sp. 1_MG-2023]|nr:MULTISPECIES: BNR-4 repeat-containing protein [unclassified Psychrosphaera]MDO6719823.1 BNR-4 repeat-containing protein [Psychrosphaera sp. 1_MG-2023]